MLKRSILLALVFFTVLLSVARGESQNSPPPLIPARIGGPVSVNGVLLTPETDSGYTFALTRPDGSPFNTILQDVDGLNRAGFFTIDIPVPDGFVETGSPRPGDTAVIHVYKDGLELPADSPALTSFTLGKSGSVTVMPLKVQMTTALIHSLSDTLIIQRKTIRDIEAAPVKIGSVATGGNRMGLSINFPAFSQSVDIWLAVQLPEGTLVFLDSEHNLTLDMVPFEVGAEEANAEVIVEEFEVCSASGNASVPEGLWTVFWLIAPTNGGDIGLIDFNKGTYDLEYFVFDLQCRPISALQ